MTSIENDLKVNICMIYERCYYIINLLSLYQGILSIQNKSFYNFYL